VPSIKVQFCPLFLLSFENLVAEGGKSLFDRREFDFWVSLIRWIKQRLQKAFLLTFGAMPKVRLEVIHNSN
jgi:hypothetical protein